MDNANRRETTPEVTQLGRPPSSFKPENNIPPPPSSSASNRAENDNTELDPPPPSPRLDDLDAGDSNASAPGPGERNPGRENLRGDQISREDDTGSGDENRSQDSDNNDSSPSDSEDDAPPPEPDTDDTPNFPPPPNPDKEEDDPAITLAALKTKSKFIEMVRDATLKSQFSPAELRTLQNPQENQVSPFDDEDLWLLISFYISSLNHAQSQGAYGDSRDDILKRYPDSNMLSYDQAKRRTSNLSGVVSWKHHMCVDSCVGFTGPFADLEACPRCDKPRYDADKLRKSGGRKKIPRKVFTLGANPYLPTRYVLSSLWVLNQNTQHGPTRSI